MQLERRRPHQGDGDDDGVGQYRGEQHERDDTASTRIDHPQQVITGGHIDGGHDRPRRRQHLFVLERHEPQIGCDRTDQTTNRGNWRQRAIPPGAQRTAAHQ